MKQTQFRSLELQARFQLDGQWWMKMGARTARHVSYQVSIDLKPSDIVFVRGEEEPPVAGRQVGGREQMKKREGLFLALATLLESFNWW